MAFLKGTGALLLRAAVGCLLTAMFALSVAGQNAAPASKAPDPAAQIAAPPASQPPPGAIVVPGGVYAYLGLPVRQVQLRGISADPQKMSQLRALIAQDLNQPLDRQKIGHSLRALYATGLFADLEVEAQRSPQNQVDLVFVATENLFIGSMTVDGTPKRPTPTQLIDSSKLELGRLFTTASLETAITQMKTVLADNGYYQAQVTLDEARHPELQQIDLHFHVVPGPVAYVGQVVIEGNPGISDAEIMEIAKLHPGDTVTAQRVTRALQRLRKHFSKQDRLEAQISFLNRTYHSETNHLDYLLRIVRGPTVDLHLVGAQISKGKLRKLVPIYEEHTVDEDLLNEGRRNIRDYLQNLGYFDVEINFHSRPAPQQDHMHIVYTVERGVKHKLTNIFISGNHYFDRQLIRERMTIQRATLLVPHGRFSQELLNRDVQSIRDLYLANGFQQVKVEGSFQDDYQGTIGRMAVFINIQEGPQTLVASLDILGTHVISAAQLRPLLTIMEGQPYSDANVATDRESILNYYFNHGFPDAAFKSSTQPVPQEPTRMQVAYTVEEGPQVFVDRILMSGLKYTKPGVVRRQFRIHPEDPLSQSQMLDTQRRLYDLGVFNAVNMAVQNPDGQARYKDLFFQFEEAKRWTFTYGLGIEIQSGAFGARQNPQGTSGASPRVSFDVTRLNVGGRAHTMSFSSHVGRLEQRGLLTYDAPRFLTHQNLRLTISAFYDNSVDVRTFTSQRLEGATQIEQVVSRTFSGTPITTLLYRFVYRRVRASNIVVAPTPTTQLFSLPVRVGMPALTYIRDRRDNPIDTHTGNYNTFDTGVASGVFGSEAAFGRFLGQNSTYYPFHAKRWVFARNLQIGLAQPFGNTLVLPLPERFFAGGGNTLRGFAINQAGPRDPGTGEPVGGNAMLVNNLELRTPPVLLPYLGDNLSFVFFHDAGNVFATTNDAFHSVLHWTQPSRRACLSLTAASTLQESAAKCNFNYISQALGAGIRYRTPIGPVRLDFGYNLNPPTFPVFPVAANGFIPFRFETLSRFNFFFSIGQTF